MNQAKVQSYKIKKQNQVKTSTIVIQRPTNHENHTFSKNSNIFTFYPGCETGKKNSTLEKF